MPAARGLHAGHRRRRAKLLHPRNASRSKVIPRFRTASSMPHLVHLSLNEAAQELGFTWRKAALAHIDGNGGEPNFVGGAIMKFACHTLLQVVHVAGAIKHRDGTGGWNPFQFRL